MEKKSSQPSKRPQVAESPVADVFENRQPNDGEKSWAEKTLAPTLEKAPEKPIGAPTGINLDEHGHARFTTISGVPIRRLYTQADLPADWSYDKYLGYPGEAPYTRGIHATGYRGKMWTMRQFSGFASPEETNQRYKYLLEHGGGGLSVAFDLPTLMGYDSDHPASEGEVGKCGVAIDSLEDMEILFDGIDLEKTTVSMTINSPASVLWAMYLVVAEKQGADWKKISGTIQNDILKEYIAQKEYIYPPAPSMRLVIDTFEFGIEDSRRASTRFRSADITSARPVRLRCRNWHSRCTTASSTSSGRAGADLTSTSSARGSASSSTRTTISSKKSPSIARRARSGIG